MWVCSSPMKWGNHMHQMYESLRVKLLFFSHRNTQIVHVLVWFAHFFLNQERNYILRWITSRLHRMWNNFVRKYWEFHSKFAFWIWVIYSFKFQVNKILPMMYRSELKPLELRESNFRLSSLIHTYASHLFRIQSIVTILYGSYLHRVRPYNTCKEV